MAKSQFEEIEQVRAYSDFRPYPPQELLDIIFHYLEEEVPDFLREDAVDVACGSGQSTEILSNCFRNILGVDISEPQIKEARLKRQPANVRYEITSADNLPVSDESVCLLTAATCFHWLNKESFFKEAKRVLAPGGVLAVYSSQAVYPVTEDEEKDSLLRKLTDKILYEDMKSYRLSCVQQLFERYENTTFPFDDVTRHSMITRMYDSTAATAAGYIRSMSTFERFKNLEKQKADTLLEEYQNRVMEVIGTKSSPERTQLKYRQEYFLILCRKSKRYENSLIKCNG